MMSHDERTTKGRNTSAQNRDTLGHCQGTYPVCAFLAKESSGSFFFLSIDVKLVRSHCTLPSVDHSFSLSFCLSISASVPGSMRAYHSLFNALHREPKNGQRRVPTNAQIPMYSWCRVGVCRCDTVDATAYSY